MLRMPARELMTMRQEFEASPDGLTLEEFVRVFLRRSRSTQQTQLESDESDIDESEDDDAKPLVGRDGRPNLAGVADLCQVFDRIDATATGKVGWEALTRFVIERGMASKVAAKERYRKRANEAVAHRKPGESGPGPLRLARWIPEIEHVCVCVVGAVALHNPFKSGGPCLVYSRELRPWSDESEGKTVDIQGSEHAPTREGSIEALDVIFAPIDDLLIVLASDATLRFFKTSKRSPEASRYVGACRLPQSYARMAWWAGCVFDGPNQGARLLCLAGPHDTIALAVHPYDPSTNRPPLVAVAARLVEQHSDVVTDLLVLHQPEVIFPGFFRHSDDDEEEVTIPRETGVLATASLDRTVCFWELPSCALVSRLAGPHKAGIRSLTYHPRQHLLFSAGFEFWIQAWSVQGDSAIPLFTLDGGHFHALCSIVAAPGDLEFVVSLDEAGRLCWWNASRDCTTQRLCQVFELEKDACVLVTLAGLGISLDTIKYLKAKAGDSSATDDELTAETRLARTVLGFSTNAVTIVCGDKRGNLQFWDASDVRVQEAPPSSLAYSPATHELVSTHGPNLKVWDTRSGALSREFESATHLARVAFDSRGLRLVVADCGGGVEVLRAHDGGRLVALPAHRGEICGLACAGDGVFVTASWDRAVHVYDENEATSRDALLRCVNHAHEADIVAVAMSRDLGLVATAAADTTLRLWDFEDLQLNGVVLATSLVLSMTFVDSFPLLVVCDVDGAVALIEVSTAISARRVSAPQCQAIACFHVPASAECVATATDDTRLLVLMGDSRGRIAAVDIKPVLDAEVTALRDSELRWRRRGYNPRRRLQRDHALTAETTTTTATCAADMTTARDVSLIENRYAWQGHDASVTCLLVVPEVARVVTASADGSIRCWTYDGGDSGVLSLGRSGDTATLRAMAAAAAGGSAMPMRDHTTWRFLDQVHVDAKRRGEHDRAREIIRHIVATKRAERRSDERARELAQARAATSVAVVRSTDARCDNACKRRERNRLFRQLDGETTWTLNAFEQAQREVRGQPPKRKKKRKKQSLLADVEIRRSDPTNWGRQDPNDPTNWGVGSINREKAMYQHLYAEFGSRRAATTNAAVESLGPSAHDAKTIKAMIEPSAFLKEKLAPVAKKRVRRSRPVPAPPPAPQPAPRNVVARPVLVPVVARPSQLPPLDDDMAASVKEKVESWQARVARYAQIFSDESSPRGHVYRAGPQLATSGIFKEPDVERRKHAKPRTRYGPRGCYPTTSITELVSAYRAVLPEDRVVGAPVRFRDLARHRVVADNAYFHDQATDLEARLGAANAKLSLREILRAFFPLLKPGELGTLLKHYMRGDDVDQDHTTELRALFDLFDLGGTGRISVADFRQAVHEGSPAVTMHTWPDLLASLDQVIAARLDAPSTISFHDFTAILDAALKASYRDDDDDERACAAAPCSSMPTHHEDCNY